DSDELPEGQRLAAFLQAVPGIFIPKALQLLVGFGESAGKWRVEDDGDLRPVDIGRVFLVLRFACRGWALCRLAFMKNLFQLVEQLLRSANAERWNKHGALVRQGALDGGLQTLAAMRAVWVAAVAIGAF